MINTALKIAAVTLEIAGRIKRIIDERKRQKRYDKAVDDPAGAIDEHFNGVPDGAKDSGKTRTPETGINSEESRRGNNTKPSGRT